MSKLIVEMEMPKDLAVIVTILPDGRIIKHLGYKDKKQIGKIVGVLPEQHGDLIDTSTVVGSIKRETDIHDVTLKEYLGFKFPVQTIVPIDEFLENRKTIPIIVAEERKDGA